MVRVCFYPNQFVVSLVFIFTNENGEEGNKKQMRIILFKAKVIKTIHIHFWLYYFVILLFSIGLYHFRI